MRSLRERGFSASEPKLGSLRPVKPDGGWCVSRITSAVERHMDNSTAKPLSHRSRSGSETRQKETIIGFRAKADERARLEGAATERGLTLSSYVRESVLDAPRTRSRRRPLADVAALSALYAQLAKSGSNLNQIAKQLNSGERVLTERIDKTLAAHWDIIRALRVALGVSE